MRKISKLLVFFLLLAVVGVLSGLSVSAQNEGKYDAAQEGIVSEYYSIDKEQGYITGIAPGTPVEKLLSTCAPYGLTVSADKVATGTKLTYTQDDQEISLTAIITGDLNGDGGISISDMLMLKSALLGDELSQLAAAAGDLNADGKVTITKVDTAISGDVVIPSTIDGCPVVEIAANAFKGCVNITSLTIPETIETLEITETTEPTETIETIEYNENNENGEKGEE